MIDLAILICRAQQYFRDEGYRHAQFFDPDHPQIGRIGLQGDAMTVGVCTDNPMIKEDMRLFADALGRDSELLGERFAVLARLLNEMGY